MTGKEPFHGRAPMGQRDARSRLSEHHDYGCGCRTCRRLRRRDALRRAKRHDADDNWPTTFPTDDT